MLLFFQKQKKLEVICEIYLLQNVENVLKMYMHACMKKKI